MHGNGIVDARRASVVAFYDGLPEPLAGLVEWLQSVAAARLGAGFVPRDSRQVHATVIGCEFPPPEHADDDRSRFDARPLAAHLVDRLRDQPLVLQFGGAVAGDTRLPSRGMTRYERSFLLAPAGVVLIGWPVREDTGDPVATLAQLRRSCEPFGVRHRYHDRPGVLDPDAYLVIGGHSCPVDGGAAAELVEAVRRELAAAPVRVRLGSEQVSLVEYTDTTLPLSSTRRTSLTQL